MLSNDIYVQRNSRCNKYIDKILLLIFFSNLILDIISSTIPVEPVDDKQQIQDQPIACSAENIEETEYDATDNASVNSRESKQDSQPEVSITISAIPTDQENCTMDNIKETDKSQEPQEDIPKDEEVGSC